MAPVIKLFAARCAFAGALIFCLPGPAPLHAATVYVVNHGWHTGLVIRRGDIPEGLWPEHRQAPPGEYLEVGWGQREFYQNQEPSLLMALRAALWPSPSVLHLAGFNGPVAAQFPNSEIAAMQADTAAITRLVNYISDAYARDQAAPKRSPGFAQASAAGNIIRLGRGLYGDSRFFAGRENFHLFKTCNVWTARALRLAGCPIDAGITADTVMAGVNACGAR